MELVQEYNDKRDYTPPSEEEHAHEDYGWREWLWLLTYGWHWFNYIAARLMFTLVALVTITILDNAHENTILSTLLVLVLISLLAGEVSKAYTKLKEEI